jgi:hypothetical protein
MMPLGKLAVAGQMLICALAVGQNAKPYAPQPVMLPGIAQVSDDARIATTNRHLLPGVSPASAGHLNVGFNNSIMTLPGTTQLPCEVADTASSDIMLPGTSRVYIGSRSTSDIK